MTEHATTDENGGVWLQEPCADCDLISPVLERARLTLLGYNPHAVQIGENTQAYFSMLYAAALVVALAGNHDER